MQELSSPIETLRQLQAMLDAGTITAEEFATLKQRLVFGPAPAAPAELPVTTMPETPADSFSDTPDTLAMGHATLPPVPLEPTLNIPLAPADDLLPPDSYDSTAPAAPRNYLNLVLSIGGLLALLGLVLYLSFNSTKSEGVTSLTRDGNDSTATYETGPQVAPLPATVAVPDTVRLVPAQPASPVAPATTSPAKADSLAIPAAKPAVAPADTATL